MSTVFLLLHSCKLKIGKKWEKVKEWFKLDQKNLMHMISYNLVFKKVGSSLKFIDEHLNWNNAQSRNLELMEKFHRQIFSLTGLAIVYKSVS